MIIWMGIFLLGFATLLVGLIHVVLGIRRKEKKRVAYAVLIPVTVWIGIIALLEADRRFIDEETRKNGGETPEGMVGHMKKEPNKAPEPTPGSVTPRARGSACDFERRDGARVAPTPVVAHL